jgi:putative DNA primase/helicase
VTQPYLVDVLTCAARFWKYNGRSKAWVPVDAPDKVAETYLARRGRWKLPVLTGIIHTPFLRADGSLCETPGYDAASGLLFKPEGESFPPIQQQPSKLDARTALAKLDELIGTFPFVADADRSVALSAILTILDRRSMVTAPLHAYTSPNPGTGKSLLVDVCAMLATGRLMPVIAQGRNEEELEKRLGAALLAGDTAISLDNCDHTLEGAFLCQVLTQRQLNIRILGQSRNAETLANATIYATGNNLVLAGDVSRRALLCSMDALCERPELREFEVNAVELAKQRRGELVAAALTVLRAWHMANECIALSPFGSFEEWSRRIRAPLIWLDEVDPCETVAEIRENDPRRAELVAVVMQWKEHLKPNTKHTVQEVVECALNAREFFTALQAVASSTGGTISNVRLGRWLKRVQGKMVGNLVLRSTGKQVVIPFGRWLRFEC